MRKPKIQVVNVVALVSLKEKIDLSFLEKQLGQMCYLVERPRALCIKLTNPKASVLLGTTGSIIIAGVRSEETAREVIHIIVKILRNIGVEISPEPNFNITNIVALIDFKRFVPLEITSQLLKPSYYDATEFPAVIWKPQGSCMSVLLYASGKAIVAGAKNISDINRVIDEMRHVFEGKRDGI